MKVSMETIKATYSNLNPEGHWFDKGTMRFFNCRLPSIGYTKGDKYYFISSEKNMGYNRAYTIRELDRNTGDIETIGSFNEMTRVEARKELANILGYKVKDL